MNAVIETIAENMSQTEDVYCSTNSIVLRTRRTNNDKMMT